MIWSLSEPFGARTLVAVQGCPVRQGRFGGREDHRSRRTSSSRRTGRLVSEVDNGATKTYHWHEGYPISHLPRLGGDPPVHGLLRLVPLLPDRLDGNASSSSFPITMRTSSRPTR